MHDPTRLFSIKYGFPFSSSATNITYSSVSSSSLEDGEDMLGVDCTGRRGIDPTLTIPEFDVLALCIGGGGEAVGRE